VTSADTSDGLDVGCEALFDPVVFLGYGRKAEMHHFVNEHPVVPETGHDGVAADMDADEATVLFAEGGAAADASAGRGDDAETQIGNGIAAVIGDDGIGGPVNPLQEVLIRDPERAGAFVDVDINTRIANGIRGVHFVCRRTRHRKHEEDANGQ
jgi:hypothetical protein